MRDFSGKEPFKSDSATAGSSKGKLLLLRRRKEKGYTLLEYAAGAAILMGVLFVGLRALGLSLEGLLTSIAEFADKRKTDLNTTTGG